MLSDRQLDGLDESAGVLYLNRSATVRAALRDLFDRTDRICPDSMRRLDDGEPRNPFEPAPPREKRSRSKPPPPDDEDED